jgi:hypothetical protein
MSAYMRNAARAEAAAQSALAGAARLVPVAAKPLVVTIAAAALFAVYLWQIFYTMPHVAVLSADSGSYLHLVPHRTVGVYYLSRVLFALWNNYYALVIAQGILLGAASLLLFRALHRVTGSALLALSALMISLFKVSWIVDTQSAASDSLFATACLALLAAAILLWQRPSPARIGLFLLCAFSACIIRPVGPAIMWPLVLVLAVRFWRQWRRALAALVVGGIAIHVTNAAIQFAHFGVPAPAHLGYVLIGGAAFIADENASANIPYAHEFAAATAVQRNEYETAASWPQKFAVMDREYNPVTWDIAVPRLLERLDGDLHSWDVIIAVNQVLQDISVAAIRHDPMGYAQMTLVKLVGGAAMFSGSANFDLRTDFTRRLADRRIAFAQDYLDDTPELRFTRVGDEDEKTRLARYIRDWRAVALDLRHDLGRPLRDSVGLLSNRAISGLFVLQTAVLVVFVGIIVLRRRRIPDYATFLLLLVVAPWSYLLAVSLTHLPVPRYLDATSLFVHIALLTAALGMFSRPDTNFRQ